MVQAGLGQNPDAVAIVGDSVVCQATLQGLVTAGNDKPVIGITPCLDPEVVNAIGADGLNGMILFSGADPFSDDPEAKLYRDVMAKYAPDTDASIFAANGFQSMLGFVRAFQAGLAGDTVTPETVAAAMKAAKNVPLPVGHGETFSCDSSAMGPGLIASTICSSILFVQVVEGTELTSDFKPLDSSVIYKSTFGG